MDVKLTKHAIDRIRQRFGIRGSDADIVNWANQKMAEATYVTEVLPDSNNDSRLFAHNGVLFALDRKDPVIITVMKPRRVATVRRKFQRLAQAERDRIERKYTAKERRLMRMQAELEIELGERKLELMRARAPYRKLSLKARIAALELRCGDIPDEIRENKRAKTKQAEGVAAYL